MPKKYIKRFMPDHEKIRNHKHLKIFGKLIHDPNLWHLNKKSVSGAFANGLFMAFVPVPFQMVLAAGAAIFARVNLPLSVALVWLTNPITMPPMFYGTYRVGAWLMGIDTGSFHFELSYEWLMTELAAIWKPFLLGCFVTGVIASVLGYFGIRFLWRWHTVKAWRQRAEKRRLRKE